MPALTASALKPRKTPTQARSAATVDAILQATLQVLLAVGKERLTTTRVAARAGVSVGTLYQYFPNKISLLQATLTHHMEGVFGAVEQVCTEQIGNPLPAMATALVTAYFTAKMKNGPASAALYAVSSDVDGLRIVQTFSNRSRAMLAELLASSSEPLGKDPLLVASVLQGSMAGVTRGLLEAGIPPKNLGPWIDELTAAVGAYLEPAAPLAKRFGSAQRRSRLEHETFLVFDSLQRIQRLGARHIQNHLATRNARHLVQLDVMVLVMRCGVVLRQLQPDVVHRADMLLIRTNYFHVLFNLGYVNHRDLLDLLPVRAKTRHPCWLMVHGSLENSR